MMLFLVLAGALLMIGQTSRTFESVRAERDFELTADPTTAQWSDAPRVLMTRDYLGAPIPGAPTEVRSRWTDRHLYLLYVCPYDELNLKPDAVAAGETPRLWDWDVVEAFIGSEEQEITRYKEFQASPRGEWLDLDIDRSDPKAQVGSSWNSGFTVRARVDTAARIWYAEMRIPFSAIDRQPPRAGRQLRLGLYRIARVKPSRVYYAWQPTGQTTFHVPAAFGTLSLK